MVGHTGYGVIAQLHHLLAQTDVDVRSDRDLLGRFTEHADADAFAVIVPRHGPMVLGVCRRLLGNLADADDAFQATFAVLMRKAPSLSRPQQLAGWLFQVAYRTARRARSARLRRQSRERPLPEIAVEAPIADVVWRELRPIFDQEVNRLPDKLRLPVVLCLMEGRTKRAAAQALGWPEGTLSCRLQQARELLQARLTRRGVTISAGLFASALVEGTASAAVSSVLVSSTVQSAALIAAGSTASGPVAALSQGVLHSMFMTKLKIMTALSLTVCILGGGAGWALRDFNGGSALAQQPAEKRSKSKVADASQEIEEETNAGPRALEGELFEEPPQIVPDKHVDPKLEKALDRESDKQAAESRSTTTKLRLIDGRSFTGEVVRETPTEIELLLPDKLRRVLKVADIDERETISAKPTLSDPERAQVPWANKLFVPNNTPPVIEHDFGAVPWGTTMTHRFTLTNIYAVPIRIMEAPRVSCSCLRIVRFTENLFPNESGFIEVEMDGRRFEGARSASIQVRFGPRYQSTAMLRLRADSRVGMQRAETSVAVAETKLANSLTVVERLRKLLADGTIEKEVLDEAISDSKMRAAEVKRAKSALNDLLKQPAAGPSWNLPDAGKEPPKNALKVDLELYAAQILERDAKRDVESAQNELANWEVKVDRLKKLAAIGTVAQTVLDEATADMQVASAKLKQAQARLQRARATLDQLNRLRTRGSDSSAPAADPKDVALSDAEAHLERLRKLNATGAVSKADLEHAQIVAAEARIVLELRTIAELRRKEMERAKELLLAKLTPEENLDKAVQSLEAAQRRLAEAKQIMEVELRKLVDALGGATDK